MIISKDLSRAFFHTHLTALRTILHTFLMINNHHIFFQVDRLCRADLNTHPARDTPCFADLLHLLTRLLGTARDPDSDVSRNEFNDLLWTGTDTGAATNAGHWIYHREIILHGDGIERANPGALPKTHTGIPTALWTAKGQVGTGTGAIPDVVEFLADIAL
jgi:hypothetical protein